MITIGLRIRYSCLGLRWRWLTGAYFADALAFLPSSMSGLAALGSAVFQSSPRRPAMVAAIWPWVSSPSPITP
jgi:hypothetical protein